jgi:hypothetical protein
MLKGLAKFGLLPIGLLALPSQSFASTAMLKPDDYVGISFWLISMALIASTAFFFLETQRVAGKW